jgi:hypothetical protein
MVTGIFCHNRIHIAISSPLHEEERTVHLHRTLGTKWYPCMDCSTHAWGFSFLHIHELCLFTSLDEQNVPSSPSVTHPRRVCHFMCDITSQHKMCDLSLHVFIVVVDHMIVSFWVSVWHIVPMFWRRVLLIIRLTKFV